MTHCSVAFEEKQDKKSPLLIRITMVIYKTNYACIPKLLSITGLFKNLAPRKFARKIFG